MKTPHASPSRAGHTAEITAISDGLRRKTKVVEPKAKPPLVISGGDGSGWYHDAAIQNLKEIH